MIASGGQFREHQVTGATVILDNVDFSVNLVADNFAFDGDTFFRARFDTDFTCIAFGLIPDDFAFDFASLCSEFFVLYNDCRTKCTAKTAHSAFLLIDFEGGFGLHCGLPFFRPNRSL